jgi:hypothetical protein
VFSNSGGFGEVLAVILLMQFLNVGDDSLVLLVFFLLGIPRIRSDPL